MIEYLNFFLLCAIFTSILYLYVRIKKYFPLLKMAEELIGKQLKLSKLVKSLLSKLARDNQRISNINL